MYGFTSEQWGVGTVIYSKLGNKTVNPGSRIQIHSVYGREGVEYAKSIQDIFTLRVHGMDNHLGNPYSSVDKLVERDNLIKVRSTRDAVIAFICWVLFSKQLRAVKINSWLESQVLKNRPIVYYKELNEPSHATAIEWLIDNYQSEIEYTDEHLYAFHGIEVTENVKKYNELNRVFDYTYMFSDDSSMYNKGAKQDDELKALYAKLDDAEKDLVGLYNNYILNRPTKRGEFKMPVGKVLPDSLAIAIHYYC